MSEAKNKEHNTNMLQTMMKLVHDVVLGNATRNKSRQNVTQTTLLYSA